MERLKERLVLADKALSAFKEVMEISSPTSIERDASIQRFEFTFEAVWKAAKQFLFDIEGLDNGSPKGVVRACREVGLLSESQTMTAIRMVDDRNLSVHTYNEALAIAIYNRLQQYVELLEFWINALNQSLNEKE